MQVKKQQLVLDMEQQTRSKLGKEYIKAVYGHSAYLTYIWSSSYKILGWVTHKWNQDFQEKYQQPHISVDTTTLMAESEEDLKSLLMRVKEESGKSWLKTQHSKS